MPIKSPSVLISRIQLTQKSRVRLALSIALFVVLLGTGSAQVKRRVAGTAAPPKISGKKQDSRTSSRNKRSGRAANQDLPLQAAVGVPVTGERGIERTTAAIMQAQLSAPPSSRPKLLPEHEVEGREDRPQNPDAKPVSSWPEAAPGSAPASGNAVMAAAGLSSQFAPQTVSTNFNAVTGPTENGAFPPDTMGAVGPTQFFLFVNGRLRTFTKAGVADAVIEADPDVFFASVMTPVSPPVVLNFTSDPNVRYDRLSGRWFVSIIDVPCTNAGCTTTAGNRWMVAVSDAASAGVISGSTVWTFYFFQTDPANFCDYPSFGIDAQALYTGCNMFTGAGSFVGTNGYVIRKTSVLSGGPLVQTTFANMALGIGAGPFAPRGVDNYDPTSNEGYFIGVDNATFSTLMIRRISTPGATPTISANISLTVPTTTSSISLNHLGNTGGTSGRIDALDDRLYAAHIRNGRLWTSHNIRVDAAGVGSTAAQSREAVRWYELNGIRSTDNGGVPIIVQSGTIFDNAATLAAARAYSIPSVVVSGQGHAALGYTTSGTPFRIDAATNGRLSGDTLGTTQTVALYTASSTAYNPPGDPGGPRRWGDYSFTSLDPLDDMTMWTVQEYCSGANTYGARVAKLLAPPPATPATAAPPNVAVGQPSVNVTITGTSVSGSGFYDPGTNLAPPALPFTHISASVTGGVVVNSTTFTSPTQVTLNLNTNGASLGAQTVTVTNPDGQSANGVGILTITAPTATTGQVLISEFRFRGPASAADEYVELYNNTNGPLDISGFTLYALTGAGAQSLRFTVPGALTSGTTVIPARGHYLMTGASYSLAAAAASDGVLSTGIVDGSSLGLFAGATPTAPTRIDSAGFDNRDALFIEGTPITPSGAGTGGITVAGEYAFVRKLNSGFPQDSGNNDADFAFVSITGGIFSTRQSTLGAPGPENLAGPIHISTGTFTDTRLDPSQPAGSAPNFVFDPTSDPPNNSTAGTITLRRTFFNNTGASITQLRFRVVDITTLPVTAGNADLRVRTSAGGSVPIAGSNPACPGGTCPVAPLTLQVPPAQPIGGGLNSSLGAGTVTVGVPLTNGSGINVEFLLGIQTVGCYRYVIIAEALPGGASSIFGFAGSAGPAGSCVGNPPTATNGVLRGQVADGNGNPLEGAAVRINGTQNRLTVTDAAGNYQFNNVETNGVYTVTPSRANYSFSPNQRSFSLVGQTTEAVFTGVVDTNLNPVDRTEYFVRQQYVDFLNREPDEDGLNFWVNNIESCGTDNACRANKRTETSAAFFLSTEFQHTGYLVYRMYQAAYGDVPDTPVPLRLSEFQPDSQIIGKGVVVLQPGWEGKLEANKTAFALEFVQRARFTSAYPTSMRPDQFVDALFGNAGVSPSANDRAGAIAEFGSATATGDVAARGRALRRVSENSALAQKEFNQAFVLMQYFGYLRRDGNSSPDGNFGGYNFWLDKLNQFNGDFRRAEMVKAFLVSGEYRGRFPR